jgi:catechol 2,3-dioxygenase-like lactoylglutathione lyase family enzyme
MPSQATIDELVIADEPAAWRGVGFAVDGDAAAVGSVWLRFEGRGARRGIVRWSLRGAGSLALDGLQTLASERPPASGGAHPNGVVAIDHVVVLTPDLDRTVQVLRTAGLGFRRLREGATPGGSARQAFFRMGEVILEVVEAPEGSRVRADADGPARLWGIAFDVESLELTAAALGSLAGKPRAAVQPGRWIMTLPREAGLGPAIAFMSPGPGAV